MAFGDVVQSRTGTSTTATTTPTLGAGVTLGNLIVLTFAADDYNGTPNAGWTQSTGMEQQTFHGGYLWWFIATSNGQTIPNYTVGSAVRSNWHVVEYAGPFNASPYDISAGQFQQTSTNNYTTPAITPTAGDRLLVAGMNFQNANSELAAPGTWLNSFTQRTSTTFNGANPRLAIGQATRVVTANGSTAYSSGATSDTAQSKSGLIIAFKAGAASSTPGQGSGSGAWSFAGAGAGKRTPKASGSGTFTFAGAGSGKRAPKATGAGTVAFVGSGVGKRTPKATGSGSFAFAGSGAGVAPSVDGAEGSGSGAWTFTGSGVGKRNPKGSGSGAFAFAGTGVGSTPSVDAAEGSGSGVFAFTGAGTGVRTPKATGSGATTWLGSGLGKRVPKGAGSGEFSWVGVGVAIDPNNITPTPASRLVVVAAEPRHHAVAPESRVLTVPHESRTVGAT